MASTWFFIKAIRGETTIAVPSLLKLVADSKEIFHHPWHNNKSILPC
jgi:hypothetical protein